MKKLNVVIQTAFLGDLILTIPLLNRLKFEQPDVDLAIVCKKGLGDFLIQEKIVDFVFEVEKSNASSYNEIAQVLNKKQVKYIYCLHKSIRSLLFSSQVKAEKKFGFNSILGFWIFDDMSEFILEAPEVIRQMKILEHTDIYLREQFMRMDISWYQEMTINLPDTFKFKAKVLAPHSQVRRIAIFPGSVWNTKRWTIEGYQQLCIKLIQAGYEVELLGAENEVDLCQSIAAHDSHILIKAGQFNVTETIKNLKDYSLVISNDSAPTHMAAYSTVPVVTIFGPTTSQMGFKPWLTQSRVVENSKLSCRPCGPHGHQECPLKHHDCMKSISAEQVFQAAIYLLETSLRSN